LANDKRLEVHLCAHLDQKNIIPDQIKQINYHFLNFRRGFWNVLWREQVDLPKLASKLSADVTFSPANYGPIFVKNAVIMIRNAVSVGFVERRPIKLAYWALLYLATLFSLVTSKSAIAVSDYAKRLGAGWFSGIMQKRMIVVPHGVDETFFIEGEFSRKKNILLAVSDIYVQKNFSNLIRAFAQLAQTFPKLKLLIAGRPIDQDYLNFLKKLIVETGVQGRVRFLGQLGAEELRTLYRKCSLFVFPSTVETFGNPLVEAMACGAPIACSNAAAMPEILGDAGSYFDPNDVGSICLVLGEILRNGDLRAKMGKKSSQRAKRYSWHKTKEMTVNNLLEAASFKTEEK
jgi:glycosyltransferase involved in cell wall biosynthesis